MYQFAYYCVMKSNKVQITLTSDLMDKFEKEAIKQKRSKSNLAKKYIAEGMLNEVKEK